MDATVARFANAARAYADEAPPPRPRPQLTRPAPTVRDFTLPCPGCSGGARFEALCTPSETQYRKREGHSRGGAQRRYCGVCKGAVPGALHRDHAPREAVPAHEGW
jgi:hypothetical protein